MNEAVTQMNDIIEQRALLAETVEKLFRDLTADSTRAPDAQQLAAQWQLIEDNGIASVCVPESAGGFGGGWQEAFVVLNSAGFYAVPLPIAETLLAQRLLARAGIDIPPGTLTVAVGGAVGLTRAGEEWRAHGSAAAVPWGGVASHVLVASHYGGAAHIALVSNTAVAARNTGITIAGEPVADLHFENATAIGVGATEEDLFGLCALARTAQIAGALNAALRLAVDYANERRQFGKPIGKFQANQHALAQLAGEAAAVNCAALAACRAADTGDAAFEIAAAKLRANRAVGLATSVAHQVHGAIGFTEEHSLHRFTQRLWSWRSEFGNDRYWASRLGALVAQRGPDNYWPDLTARSDRR